jgi:hypothetical protein
MIPFNVSAIFKQQQVQTTMLMSKDGTGDRVHYIE